MAQPRGILPRKLPRKVRKGEIKSSLATPSVNFALGTWGLSPPLARRTTSHPPNHTELRDKASESEERAPQKNPKHGIRDRRIRGRGRSRSRRAHLGGGSTGAAEAEAETRCQHPSRSRAPLAFVGRSGGGGDTEYNRMVRRGLFMSLDSNTLALWDLWGGGLLCLNLDSFTSLLI